MTVENMPDRADATAGAAAWTGPTTVTTHRRVELRFDGELDDVPTASAVALARVARALLQHADQHDGEPARIRMARLGPLLNLWLTDPACSPACLGASGHVSSTNDHHDPGDVRLVLDPGPHGGLRLHWALVLVGEPEPEPAPPDQTLKRNSTTSPSAIT